MCSYKLLINPDILPYIAGGRGVMMQVKATVKLPIYVNLRTDIPRTEFIISVSTDSRTKAVFLRNANILIRI